jgi:hypothetical protein
MKKYKLLFLFSLIVSYAFAQDISPKEMVEKNWGGLSEQSANFTRSGKVQLKQTLRLILNADNTVSGRASTTMVLDGVSYTNISYITGTFYSSNWTLYIQEGSTISEDALPSGLKWCKGYGTLTFYKNKNHSGYYLLKGNLNDDCSGNSLAEYSDYPY